MEQVSDASIEKHTEPDMETDTRPDLDEGALPTVNQDSQRDLEDPDAKLFAHIPPAREEPNPIPRQAAPPVGRFKAHLGSRGLPAAAREYQLMKPQYHKLAHNSTRLLWLKADPKTESMAVFVQLAHATFKDLEKISYEALSYEWGPADDYQEPVSQLPTQTKNLELKQPVFQQKSERLTLADLFAHGISQVQQKRQLKRAQAMFEHRQFFVSRNLYAALRRLRQKEKDVLLWIDAICIDQDDQTERSHQINHMSRIYSRAHKVLIWLGPGDSKTDDAIDFIKKRILHSDGLSKLLQDKTAKTVASWENMVHLMRSTWFSRRWVVQELALARSPVVFCGNGELHWIDLRDAIDMISQSFDTIKESLKHSKEHDFNSQAVGDIAQLPATALIATVNDIFRLEGEAPHQRQPMLTLEQLVSKLAPCHTSDPRDTITAFRNIAKETYLSSVADEQLTGTTSEDDGKPPKPDYSKDLLQCYIEFVAWIQNTTKCIDILCRRWAIPERPPDNDVRYKVRRVLPSWIQTIDTMERVHSKQSFHGESFVGLPDRSLPYAASGPYKAEYMHYNNYRPSQKQAESQKATNGNAVSTTATVPTAPAGPVVAPVTVSATSPPAEAMNNQHVLKAPRTDEHGVRHPAIPQTANGGSAPAPFGPGHGNQPLVNKAVRVITKGKGFAASKDSHRSAGAQAVAGAQKPTSPKTSRRLPVTPTKPSKDATGSGSRTPEQQSDLHTQPQKASAKPSQPAQPSANAPLETDVQTPVDTKLSGEEESCRLVINQLLLDGIDASIELEGVIVGTVERITPPTINGNFSEAALELLLDKPLTYKDVSQHIDQRIWRCLVAERGAEGRIPGLTMRACREVLSKTAEAGRQHIEIVHLLDRKPEVHVAKFLKRMLAVVSNRSLILVECTTAVAGTSSPSKVMRLGFGPEKLQPTDLLCVLYGCSVPVVLRKHQHPNKKVGTFYRFIGEAYLYGIMDGEAMPRNAKEKKDATERFRLF